MSCRCGWENGLFKDIEALRIENFPSANPSTQSNPNSTGNFIIFLHRRCFCSRKFSADAIQIHDDDCLAIETTENVDCHFF